MALWFGRLAGLPSDGGYFYLCPSCYAQHVEPHLPEVLDRLVEQHPFLHRLRGDHDGMPLRQAGASPVPHGPAPHDPAPPATAPGPAPRALPVPLAPPDAPADTKPASPPPDAAA